MIDDVRIWAVVLAAGGAAAALFLPFHTVVIITGAVIAATVAGLWSICSRSWNGTSAGLGAAMLVFGSAVCLLVPMWITLGVHRLLR